MESDLLITGATGTIGQYLVKLLKKEGASFKVLVRSEEKAQQLQEEGIQAFLGDLDEPASLKEAMRGVSKLFLLSAASLSQVQQQRNAIEAAKVCGVKHIIKVSSLGTSLSAPTQLGRMHAHTEAEIRKAGFEWTFLHPHSFMQNFFTNCQTIRRANAFYARHGKGKYSPVDARDIAQAAARVLTSEGHEGKTYVITGPEAVSMKDVARTLELLLDREIRFIPITHEENRKHKKELGMPEWLAHDLAELDSLFVNGKAGEISPDFEELTGRRGTSLRQFIEDHYKMFA